MKQVPKNIKAELLLSLLKTIRPETKFTISYDSKFKRNYLQDVSNINQVLTQFNKQENTSEININISRDGLYKSLPQSLFHNINRFSKSTKLKDNTEKFTEEMSKQKQEVENAKKFLEPFDSFLFKLALNHEFEVNKLLNNDILLYIKQVLLQKEDISSKNIFINRTIYFLPFIKKIKGNSMLIADILSCILQAEVCIEKKIFQKPLNLPTIDIKNQLGKTILSENFIVGEKYHDTYYEWNLIIDSNRKQVAELMNSKHEIDEFLDFFSGFFLPANVEPKLIIKTSDFTRFVLGKENIQNCFLGLNARL